MLRKKLAFSTLCLLSLLLFSTSAQAVDINKVTITADNAYHFGWGSVNGISAKTTPFYVQFPFVNFSVPIPDYHVGHTWNAASSEIFANGAETYPTTLSILSNQIPIPAGGKINTTTDDYLYITCYTGPKTVPYVDVVVVIDESRSMEKSQKFTKTLITNLEAKLMNSGIGSGGTNRYGLVGFGGQEATSWQTFWGATAHLAGHAHPVGTQQALFGTASQYSNAVGNLKTNGGTEDGYSGIHFALDNYTFRPLAKKFIILVTDENRDDVYAQLTWTNTLTALNSNDVTLNAIITCDIRDKDSISAMAIDANAKVFIEDTNGTFTTDPGGSITSISTDTSVQDYASIAFATDGLVGDIRIISDVTKTASFSEALAVEITAQANKPIYRGVIAEVFVSSPDKNLFTGAGEWEVYATGVTGNGNGNWSKTNPPSISEINTQIKLANSVSGVGNSSRGWVNANGVVLDGAGQPDTSYSVNSRGRLEIGEKNDSNNGYFDIVNAMSEGTQWMWYNPDPATVTKPFETGPASKGQNNGASEFLIFRLPVRKLHAPSQGNGSCCDDCCDEKFKVSFDPGHKINLDPKTGRLDLSHFFRVDVKGPPTREIAKVNATLISSWKTCNGQKQSLGMHFWQPPPPIPGIASLALSPVLGWNSKLTSPPFSHELTWTRNDLFNTPSSFSLNQPLALTIPVIELRCADTIGFCIKYTFIDSECQVCEEVVKCYEYRLRTDDTRRLTLEEAKPTLAPPRVPMDDSPRTGPSRTSPSRTGPSRTNPSRTNPSGTDRPTIRRPLDVRPVAPQRGANRPVISKPTEEKRAPQKSDREKPAVKKPAERKEAEAKRVADESANRSVLLKK